MLTRIIYVASAILFSLLYLLACGKEEPNTVKQVKIGELRNGVPTLTYSDMPKLKRALQLAFLPSMRIDSVFLHEDIDATGNTVILLTAKGQETDSIYSSVNITTRQVNGISLVSEPVNPDVPRWCWTAFGCAECYVVNTICNCTAGGPGSYDKPCSLGSFGVVRPDNLLEIMVAYLSKE